MHDIGDVAPSPDTFNFAYYLPDRTPSQSERLAEVAKTDTLC